MKTTIITALLLLAMVSGAVAQERWEYATIIYHWGAEKLSISTDGKEYSEEKVTLPRSESSPYNSNPLLKKAHEFEDKGWELVNVTSVPSVGGGSALFAYLRKKKQ